jgi:hypothetical protein
VDSAGNTLEFFLSAAVLQKLRVNTMGVKPHFLLSLGGHSKQAGDERDLTLDQGFSQIARRRGECI